MGHIKKAHAYCNGVIMGAMASKTTGLTILYSTVYSCADQRKHQTSRHWPLCGEFSGDRWIPCTNGQRRGKCFHLMTSSCIDSEFVAAKIVRLYYETFSHSVDIVIYVWWNQLIFSTAPSAVVCFLSGMQEHTSFSSAQLHKRNLRTHMTKWFSFLWFWCIKYKYVKMIDMHDICI